jgi:hypothetical protein
MSQYMLEVRHQPPSGSASTFLGSADVPPTDSVPVNNRLLFKAATDDEMAMRSVLIHLLNPSGAVVASCWVSLSEYNSIMASPGVNADRFILNAVGSWTLKASFLKRTIIPEKHSVESYPIRPADLTELGLITEKTVTFAVVA